MKQCVVVSLTHSLMHVLDLGIRRKKVEAEIQDAKSIIDDLEQRLADTTHQLQETTTELKQSQEARYQFERQAIALGAEVNQLRENSTHEELMKRILALESKNENG